jgi:hypothetical protein
MKSLFVEFPHPDCCNSFPVNLCRVKYPDDAASHLALVVDGEVAVHGVRQGVNVGRILVLRLSNI